MYIGSVYRWVFWGGKKLGFEYSIGCVIAFRLLDYGVFFVSDFE